MYRLTPLVLLLTLAATACGAGGPLAPPGAEPADRSPLIVDAPPSGPPAPPPRSAAASVYAVHTVSRHINPEYDETPSTTRQTTSSPSMCTASASG